MKLEERTFGTPRKVDSVSLKETCLVLLRTFVSRMLQLILLKFFLLFCVFMIISQGCPLGLAVEPICMQMSAPFLYSHN